MNARATLAILLTIGLTHAQRDAWEASLERFQDGRLQPSEGSCAFLAEGAVTLVGNGPSALLLEGGKAHLRITGSVPPFPAERFTVGATVFVHAPTDWGGFVSMMQDNGEYERGLVLGYRGQRFMIGAATQGTGRLTYLIAPENFTLDRWYHVAATYDGHELVLLVNGVEVARSIDPEGALLPADPRFVTLAAYRDDNELFGLDGMLHAAFLDRSAMTLTDLQERQSTDLTALPIPVERFGPFLSVEGPFARVLDPQRVELTFRTRANGRAEVRLQFADGTTRVIDAPQRGRAHTVQLTDLPRDQRLSYRIRTIAEDGEVGITTTFALDTSFFYDVPRDPLARVATECPERQLAAANRILEHVGTLRGLALVLDTDREDAHLVVQLARRSKLRIVVLEPDPEDASVLRRRLDEENLYGDRVSVFAMDPRECTIGDSQANLVLAPRAQRGILPCAPEGVVRLLCPGSGIVYVTCDLSPDDERRSLLESWLGAFAEGDLERRDEGDQTTFRFVRDPLPGAREWTHQYAALDNSASSEDERLRGPLEVQWWGRPGPRPMPDRGPRNPAPLYADGKLYVQGDRILFGMDAYNGTILWSWQIPALRRANMPRDGSNMAAAREGVTIALEREAITLDATTGAVRARYDVPIEGCAWGFLGLDEHGILGTATHPQGHYVGDQGEWYNDLENDQTARVVGSALFAYDRGAREPRWIRRGTFVHSTIAGNGSVLYALEGRDDAFDPRATGRATEADLHELFLVAIDRATGSTLWERRYDHTLGAYMTYLSVRNGTILVTSTDAERKFHLEAFAEQDGHPTWSHVVDTLKTHHSGWLHHPVLRGERIHVNKHTYDLATGKVLAVDEGFDWHGCGVMTASAHTLFQRIEYHGMQDVATGERTEFLGVRGGCWLGQIPAGGMLLAPETSAGCSCTHAIQTSMAFAPVETLVTWRTQSTDAGRLLSPELADEDLTVRYTLDGSEPDRRSPVLAGPLAIAAGDTLTYKVYRGDTALGPARTTVPSQN